MLKSQRRELEVPSPVNGRVISWDPSLRLTGHYVQKGSVLLRLADLDKTWQLELRMPEDRSARILRARNALYASLRDRVGAALHESLREPVANRLREQLRAQASTPPPVEQAVPAPDANPPGPAAAALPNAEEDLERQVAAALEKALDQEAEARLGEIPDKQLRPKLLDLTGEDVEDRLPVEYILASAPSIKHYGWIEDIHWYADLFGDEGSIVKIKVAIDKDEIQAEELRHSTSVTAKVACGQRALGYVLFHDLFAWVQKMWFRWF